MTIGFAYYDQPKMVEKWESMLDGYPDQLRDRLRIVICDDASPQHPLKEFRKGDNHLHVEIWRITKDVPWNQMGARNVIMQHTAEWACLLDPDHIPPWTLATKMVEGMETLDLKRYYLFNRVYARSGEKMGTGPNLYMVHATAYWRAGGMDEQFAGHKGWSDITFRDAMEATGTKHTRFPGHESWPGTVDPLCAYSWKDWKEAEPPLIEDAAVVKLDRDIRKNEDLRNSILRSIKRKRQTWKGYISSLQPFRYHAERVYASHT